MTSEEYNEEIRRFEEELRKNVFVLEDKAVLNFLVHFPAPFTGGVSFEFPKGSCFKIYSEMSKEAFYILWENKSEKLSHAMWEKAKQAYSEETKRPVSGISLFITHNELKSIPLRFASGSLEGLFDLVRRKREDERKEYEKKQKEEQERLDEWFEDFQCNPHKVEEVPSSCSRCGGKIMPVIWDEPTDELRQKMKGKAFFGIDLYGRKYSGLKNNFVCCDCGECFVVE